MENQQSRDQEQTQDRLTGKTICFNVFSLVELLMEFWPDIFYNQQPPYREFDA